MKAEIGTSVHLPSAKGLLDAIVHAESVGIPAFWLTTGAGPDALTVFAAAAPATRSIRMGTAVVPTFPRNPVVVAQQSLDIASLAPGRFRLGLGPSHAPTIQNRYGLPYERPLEHLREFVAIVKGLLAGGTVRFAGKRYTLEATLSSGADVPIMVSALRAGSFELAGEITDGAITWLCPARYIRDVGMPAMARGAERAGRARPPMIGQVFLALTESEAELHAAVERGLTYYPRLPNYQEMFAAAGLPEAREGRWSQAMIDATVIHGDESACAAKLDAFLETAGCEHLIVSVLATGSDQSLSIRRSLDLIGRYATAR
jgi:F420-dependent oxidoreductase-like protein